MAKSVQVINDSKNYRFLRLLCFDDQIGIEKASSFERFAALCDCLENARGSRVRSEFLEALSLDLGGEIPLGIDSDRELQKAVWRRINGDFDANIDIAKKRIRSRSLKTADGFLSVADISLLSKEALPTELDGFIEKLTKYDAIALDMGDFVYERPDEYHSALAYKKLVLGQSISDRERSALFAWVICRVIMRKNTNLLLLIKNGLTECKGMLDLLFCRRLYPNIYLCFDDVDLCTEVSEICLDTEQKNISPKIIISEETDVSEIIRRLAREIPLSRISSCDIYSSDTARRRFEEALDSFIGETEGE